MVSYIHSDIPTHHGIIGYFLEPHIQLIADRVAKKFKIIVQTFSINENSACGIYD